MISSLQQFRDEFHSYPIDITPEEWKEKLSDIINQLRASGYSTHDDILEEKFEIAMTLRGEERDKALNQISLESEQLAAEKQKNVTTALENLAKYWYNLWD